VADPLFLLDTNICIYVLDDRGSLPARRLAECVEGAAFVSAITAAELWRWPGLTGGKHRDVLRKFFERLPILPFDEQAAMTYAQLPFRRGSFDRLIAAHALARGLTLVTSNERDFADVDRLRVENWARP
jgi:tRNA(fMet)-specific endonuclease VapC